MVEPAFRPIPGDPSGPMVSEVFNARAKDWILGAPGEHHTAAVEAYQLLVPAKPQHLVIVQWPGRRNHTKDLVTVRMMMGGEDAVSLGESLLHSGRWIVENFPNG